MTPSPFSRLASGAVSGLLTGLAQAISGVKTFAETIIASAGIQVGSLFNTNGTGSTDVGVKIGVSPSDGSVNGSAKLASFRTGIGGTEVEAAHFLKSALVFPKTFAIKWDALGGNSWQIEASPDGGGSGVMRFGNNASRYMALRFSDGYTESSFGFEVNPTTTAAVAKLWGSANPGRFDQSGTDSTGTPGAATINKPTGISAIAAAVTTVVITNSLVTATSRVLITWHGDLGTQSKIPWVTRAAGSFTVNVGTAPAGAVSFSWEVSTIL